VAPTSSCRTSVGVAVLDNHLYAVGGQDGVSCLSYVEKSVAVYVICFSGINSFLCIHVHSIPPQNVTTLSHYNSDIHESILIIFGTNVPEK